MIAIGRIENLGFHKQEVLSFMESADDDFIPPIASRVDLGDYVDRLMRKAAVFVAYRDSVILGLAACYCNDHAQRIADLSYLAVHKKARRTGIGKSLILHCKAYARKKNMHIMRTKTPEQNTRVIHFYLKLGFAITGTGGRRSDGSNSVFLEANLRS